MFVEDSYGKWVLIVGLEKQLTFYTYEADRIVAETNNGGDLVERLIRGIDSSISYKQVMQQR